jgi:raffinose/stachyose/melibiose transport system permease protein
MKSAAKTRASRKRVASNRVALLVFVMPAFILFTVFMTLPIFASVYYSLFSWDGIGKMLFVGARNYVHLIFQNFDDFYTTLKNSLIFAGMSVFIQLPIALVLALVLSSGVKGENFFRTVYFIPVVISSVIIGVLFLKVYNPDYGLLNTFLKDLGLAKWQRAWLGDTKTALVAAFAPLIWQYVGYHMLLLYSAIKQIPQEYNEAAKLDGATELQAALRIKIPLIVPMLEVCVIFAVIGSLKIFDLVYVLTGNGQPFNSTRVPTGLMYTQLFQHDMYGMGTTTAMFIVLECFVFTVVIQRAFKSWRAKV